MTVEIIAPGRSSFYTYDTFAEGVSSRRESFSVIKEIVKNDEYSISLQCDDTHEQFQIFCRAGVKATFEFDSFWLIFPRNYRRFAEIAMDKIKAHFDDYYHLADPEMFACELLPVLDEIENMPEFV